MISVKGLEFEKMLISAAFRRDFSLVPTTYYLGLGTGALPAKTATLSAITEVTGSGYARLALVPNGTDFPTFVVANGDWKIQSATKRWTATGDWTAADYVFLTDVAAGTAGRFFGAVTIDPVLLRNGETYDEVFEYQEYPF